MQLQSRAAILNDPADPDCAKPPCTGPYNLHGPQVEPQASYWLAYGVPKMLTQAEVTAAVAAAQSDPALNPTGIASNLKYPTAAKTLNAELEELVQLSRLRDEAGQLRHDPADPDPTKESQRLRLPLSFFLQLRPQPLGAAINTARDQNFPVIATGREMARYIEAETPGLPFRVALDYLIRERANWSPPRQAVVWAGLFVTIASALEAAWFYKWRGGAGIQYRPRPWECNKENLDVLFDRVSNSTNSADGPRRGFPGGVPPIDFKGGEQLSPESFVIDICKQLTKSQPSPGTPRHPAYPSGHSTYSAAAAEYLAGFFPEYKIPLDCLADNIGIGRLWAGVHWRTDHTFGQLVGRAVGRAVYQQIAGSCIQKLPPPKPINTPPAQNAVPDPCKP